MFLHKNVTFWRWPFFSLFLHGITHIESLVALSADKMPFSCVRHLFRTPDVETVLSHWVQPSPLCVTFYVSWGDLTERKLCRTGCSQNASLLCATVYVSLGHLTKRKPYRNGCRQKAYILCMLSYMSLGFWPRKNITRLWAGQMRISSMGQEVGLQCNRLGKILITKGAGWHYLHCVWHLVSRQFSRDGDSAVFHIGQRLGWYCRPGSIKHRKISLLADPGEARGCSTNTSVINWLIH